MTALTTPENHSDLTAGHDAPGVRRHHVCDVDALEDAWGGAALVDDHQVALFRLSPTEVYAVGLPVAQAALPLRPASQSPAPGRSCAAS